MTILARILKVGSIAQSMSVYLPAILLQRGLGLLRVVMLTYLIGKDQMGLWGLGVTIFTMAGPLMTLGASHGLVRYVSVYEARGQLGAFFRRAMLWTLLLTAGMTTLVVIGSDPIVGLIAAIRSALPGRAGPSLETIPWALGAGILANVAAMAIYLNLLAFVYGLRAYRLAAVVELLFGVLFTAGAFLWVSLQASALSLLLAHLVALGVAMACCGWLLYLAVRGISREDVARASEAERINPAGLEPTVEAEGDPVTGVALATDTDDEQFEKSPSIFGHVIRFGLVALISALIWQAAENVSYLMIYVWFGSEYAGPYHVFIRFSQPLLFISNAAWAVLYTHIARRWEADDRDGAMFVFETSYKAIGLATMSLTVLIYITSPWWSQILDVRYQVGRYYLPGLLTFFMTICNLSLLVVLTKLHERPGVIALAALAGAAANVILAALWMPVWGEVGAARAAGVGIYFGGGLVMLVYLLASNTRLQDSTYFILGTPILLLLPRWIIGPLWAVVLPVCLFSSWVFNARQRNALAHTARRSWHAFMELRPWQR